MVTIIISSYHHIIIQTSTVMEKHIGPGTKQESACVWWDETKCCILLKKNMCSSFFLIFFNLFSFYYIFFILIYFIFLHSFIHPHLESLNHWNNLFQILKPWNKIISQKIEESPKGPLTFSQCFISITAGLLSASCKAPHF